MNVHEHKDRKTLLVGWAACLGTRPSQLGSPRTHLMQVDGSLPCSEPEQMPWGSILSLI